MRLPENALNIPNLAPVKMETAALLTPTKLWTRTEVLARPCPVPASAGVFSLRGIRFAAGEPFKVPGSDSDNFPSGVLQDSQKDAE
jgi:hypothetical protein